MNDFNNKFNIEIKSINSKEEFHKLMSNLTNNILDYKVPSQDSSELKLNEIEKYVANIANLLDKQKKYIEADITYEYSSTLYNDKINVKSIYEKYQEMKRKKLLLLKGKENKVEENNFIQDKSNSLLYNKFKIKKEQ